MDRPPGHTPVLRADVVALLAPAARRVLVDCTIGTGGHAEAILDGAGESELCLIGMDVDESNLRLARHRLRHFGQRVRLFQANFADIREVPNTLYDLYERHYGVTIARAVERLAAVAADERDAKLLETAPGAPLLEIDRTALALNGAPVEWRVSRCLTATHHYRVELG